MNQPQPTPQPSEEVTRLNTELTKLRNENAAYRTQRNAALRLAEARRQVLDAHNISFTTEGMNLDSIMTIENGAATGDIGYKPPAITPPVAPTPTPAEPDSKVLTMDRLRTMSVDEIKRLPKAEVDAAMRESANKPKE